MAKIKKIVYYSDELRDEFSTAVIQPRPIDENYDYGGDKEEQFNNVDQVRDEFQKIVDKSLKLPKPVSPDHIVVNTAMPVFSFPDSASDNDVIEMWIKAIKQVLENTKDNPNLRSQQINALQEQYLLMRYGKTLDEKDNRE